MPLIRRCAMIGFCTTAILVGALMAIFLKVMAETFKPNSDQLMTGVLECLAVTLFAGLVGAAIGALIGKVFQRRSSTGPLSNETKRPPRKFWIASVILYAMWAGSFLVSIVIPISQSYGFGIGRGCANMISYSGRPCSAQVEFTPPLPIKIEELLPLKTVACGPYESISTSGLPIWIPFLITSSIAVIRERRARRGEKVSG